jgi:hypothetical protein
VRLGLIPLAQVKLNIAPWPVMAGRPLARGRKAARGSRPGHPRDGKLASESNHVDARNKSGHDELGC